MASSPDRLATRGSLQTLVVLALFLALTLLPAVAGDEDPPRTSLDLDATARLTQVGPAGRQSVQLILKARNRSDVAIEIERGTLLLEHEGGWLTPLEEEPAERIFRAPIVVAPGTARVLADRAACCSSVSTRSSAARRRTS